MLHNNKLYVSSSDNCRCVHVVFRMRCDAVPADHRTASNSNIKVCFNAVRQVSSVSMACCIDSLTRNLAIMSHEGRAVVKSSANGYAGGCHPIRIVICRQSGSGSRAERCLLCTWFVGVQFQTDVRKFCVFQNVYSGILSFRNVPAAVCPGIQRLEREAEYSPPCSAEVKNEWSCTSTALMFRVVYTY